MPTFSSISDLQADLEHRIERGGRVLEDHRHALAAQVGHLVGGELQEVAALEPQLAGLDPPRRRDEAHDGERRHALAAAGLTDDAEHLALVDPDVHAVDRLGDAVAGMEPGAQVAHLQDRLAARFHGSFSLNRSQSFMPSPSRLKPSTVIMMARPGKNTR
jgi:hypothetical protein